MKICIIFNLSLVFFVTSVSTQISYPNDDACTTPHGRSGKCINIKSCPNLLSLLKKSPITLQNVRFLKQSQCGYRNNNPEVCCETNNGGHSSKQTERPSTGSYPRPPDVTNHPNLHLLDHKRCGPINHDKIIGGEVTQIQEFPWMALLAYDVGKSSPEFRCGGSVINERYVLTAAHCVAYLTSNLDLTGVRVGEHNLKMEIDCANIGTEEEYCNEPYQDFAIQQIIHHPEYSVRTFRNDIALIRLDRNINFKPENARPICLPIGPAALISTTKLTVTGWGVINWKQESSPIMLKVHLPRFPQDECVNVYKQKNEVWYKQICMGGENGKDSCSGDSGGPLQGPTKYRGVPRFVQYGLVSFGVRNCGNPRFPGVYTRIDYYLDWILDNMSA